MLKRFVLRTASLARVLPFLYCARPMPARTIRIPATTSSSISVKPRALPVFVFRSIECRRIRGCVYVEDVLPAPARGVGLVLVRAQAPLGFLRHRISGDAAKEFQLAAGLVIRRADAVDQR